MTKLEQPNQNQSRLNQTETKNIAETILSGKFLVNSDMFGIKKHALKLVEPNQKQNKNIAKAMVSDKVWVNSDMFGIKKHVLKLGN